jgi:Asp-tRNA(Asn)/Glu-tRNA(Gln) amidotransferase A subunit family amidase
VTDFWRLSAAELLEGYAHAAFTPLEVTQALLERIDRKNEPLRAYLAIDRDGALAAARKATAVWAQPGERPLLCGVPVNVKDTIEMAGMPTTYGSLAFKDNLQPDAEIVKRLRVAGAIILGKTNSPEFALAPHCRNRLGAPAANPWDLARTPGGSTGGGAAAVAAGLGPLCIGTDSGGSVRLPAAYTGLFALKPTFQRIPAVQNWRASPGRSHNGPITRTVRDAALMMQALAGPHPSDGDSARDPEVDYLGYARGNVRGARVAFSRDFGRGIPLDAEQEAFLQQACDVLRDLGCTLLEANPPVPKPGPDELAPGVWSYSGDHYAAAEALVPDFWAKHSEELTEYAKPIYDAGRTALAWQYRRILRRDRAFAEAMRRWFFDYDFLLSPCAPPAPRNDEPNVRDDSRGQMKFLAPFNLSYNPAASLPMGLSAQGLPISVQVVGKLGNDVGTLRLAALMEGLNPWAGRWPAYATDA